MYVARQSGSIDIATRLVDSITDRFFLLARFPYLGDFGPGARTFPIGDYVIIYCFEEADVFILRVVHGRRDLEELFGR